MKTLIRPGLSTSLVLFFFLILLFLGLFAEVFKTQSPEVDLAQIYANPIPMSELEKIKSLRLTNKHGDFLFENTHPDGRISGPWQMVEPQSLRVRDGIVEKLIETLNVVRVRNFHRLEPINITSFSLDNPTLTLRFNTWKNKSYIVKVGLINPIDNSAYLTLSSQDQIYQIDPLEMALESYDLPQLVESKILVINTETLASLELYEQNSLVLKLMKKDENWVDQVAGGLTDSKISKFFERLQEIKSNTILDDLTANQKDFMNKVMSSATYTLKIISNQGVRNYFFAEIKDSIEATGLPKEVQGSFVMASEDRDSYVLLHKEQLKVFQTRSKDLK